MKLNFQKIALYGLATIGAYFVVVALVNSIPKAQLPSFGLGGGIGGGNPAPPPPPPAVPAAPPVQAAPPPAPAAPPVPGMI